MRGFTQIVLFSVILSVVAGLDTFIADSVFEVGEGWTHGNYDEVCCFSAENDCYGLPQSQYGTCIALLGGYDGPVSGAMTNSFYLPDNNKNFHNYTLEFEALGIGSGKINVSVNGDVFTLESYADTPTVYSALITDSVILGQINQISFSYSFAASEFLIVNLVNVYTMELVEPTNILQNGHFEGVSHWTTTANNIFCAPTFQYPYDGNCSAVFGDAIPENSIVTQSLFVPKVTAGSEVWAKWRYAVIGENFPGNFTFNIGSITYDLLSNEPGRFSYIWWVTTFNITSMADGTYHDIFWHFDGPADFNIFLDDAYVNVFGSIDNTTTSTTGGSTTSGGSTTGPAPVKQIVVDPSFEQMNPPLPWTQVRTYNDRPLICCDFDCGNTEVLNVVDGSCAVWFGFRPDQTVESVYQDLVIPTLNSGSASVSFHIYVGPGGGFFSVKLDNTELRRYNQSTTSYQQQTIDVTSYADGQSHKLEFHFESDDGKQMFLDLAQLSGDFVVDTTTTGAVITGATATTGSFVTTTAATTGHIVSTTGYIVSTTGTTGGGSPTGSVTSTGETVSTTEGDDDNNGTTTFVGSLNSSAWTVQSSILFCLACIVFAMF